MNLEEYIFKNKLWRNHMEKNFFMGKKYFFSAFHDLRRVFPPYLLPLNSTEIRKVYCHFNKKQKIWITPNLSLWKVLEKKKKKKEQPGKLKYP